MPSHTKSQPRPTAALTRVTQGYLALMCSVVLLLPALSGYEALGRCSFFVCTGISLAYLVVLLLAALELAITGQCPLSVQLAPLAKCSTARICFLLYGIWCILSAVCSPYDRVWLGSSRYEGLCFLLLCLLIYWTVSSYGRWNTWLAFLLGTVVLINLGLALAQYAGFNPLHLFPPDVTFHDAFVLYNGRFLGTLGNVDLLGGFLCLTIPVCYGAFLTSGRTPLLVFLGGGALLLALADVDAGYVGLAGALLLTLPLFYSRSSLWPRGAQAVGILAACLGLGKLLYADREQPLTLIVSPVSALLLVGGIALSLVGLLLARHNPIPPLQQPPSKLLFHCLTMGIAVLAALGLACVSLIPFSSGPLYELNQILHGNLDPTFGSGRVRIWQEVIRLIGEHPLLGGGPDTLAQRITFTFSRYVPEVGTTIEAYVDSAHNEFLNIAANLGLPALGFYLAGLVCWLRSLRRHLSPAVLVLLSGTVGYLIQICFTVSCAALTTLFWIFLALCEADINSQTAKEDIST